MTWNIFLQFSKEEKNFFTHKKSIFHFFNPKQNGNMNWDLLHDIWRSYNSKLPFFEQFCQLGRQTLGKKKVSGLPKRRYFSLPGSEAGGFWPTLKVSRISTFLISFHCLFTIRWRQISSVVWKLLIFSQIWLGTCSHNLSIGRKIHFCAIWNLPPIEKFSLKKSFAIRFCLLPPNVFGCFKLKEKWQRRKCMVRKGHMLEEIGFQSRNVTNCSILKMEVTNVTEIAVHVHGGKSLEHDEIFFFESNEAYFKTKWWSVRRYHCR